MATSTLDASSHSFNDETTKSSTPTKYPSQFMLPIHRTSLYPTLYTSIDSQQTVLPTRPTSTTVQTAEINPLSPQKSTLPGMSSSLPSTCSDNTTSSISSIPLTARQTLTDPRLASRQSTDKVVYLESHAVKKALDKQKRHKTHAHSNRNSSVTHADYHLIPLISRDDHEQRTMGVSPLSTSTPSLFVSVTDCFHFGFDKHHQQTYIDLDENNNRLAFEHLQVSNELHERTQQIQSRQLRLRLREKRQRRTHEQANSKHNEQVSSTAVCQQARRLLNEHRLPSSFTCQLSNDVLNFFSYEYRHETRPHVKRMLVELVGVYIEKYRFERTTNEPVDEPSLESKSYVDRRASTGFYVTCLVCLM
jgi:hypothetical protein